MSRIINQDGPGKERKLLSRAIVIAIRKLAEQDEFNFETQDLLAFIILSLDSITKTVERTVYVWEKRDYWLKADRFRLDWSWSENCSIELKKAYKGKDIIGITTTIAKIGQKLSKVKVSDRNRMGAPWKGCRGLLE
ncbi:hypothetical protein ACFLXB_00880 [Chloroflexota bacterium]